MFDESHQGFHLFDQQNVRMLPSPTTPCDMEYVVLAPSAPGNTKLKEKLRTQLRGAAALVFILPRPPTEDMDKILAEENNQHGDILQGDFADSYSTVPYKTVMGFILVKR